MKITFLFSPVFISFQSGLCARVWIHWDACELSTFRSGCSFIQMSCYKTISPAPFCLISFCINPFWCTLTRGCWWLQRVSLSSSVCAGTVTVFSPVLPPCSAHHTLLFSLMCSPSWQLALVGTRVSSSAELQHDPDSVPLLILTMDPLFSSQLHTQTASGILFAFLVVFFIFF